MKETIAAVGGIVAVFLGGLLLSGCCSIYATSQHNRSVEGKLIRASVANGGAALGVDVRQLTTGYFAAWRASPGMMAAATTGDLLLAAGAAYLLRENNREDHGQEAPERATYDIESDNCVVIINDGEGNNVEYNQDNSESVTGP